MLLSLGFRGDRCRGLQIYCEQPAFRISFDAVDVATNRDFLGGCIGSDNGHVELQVALTVYEFANGGEVIAQKSLE